MDSLITCVREYSGLPVPWSDEYVSEYSCVAVPWSDDMLWHVVYGMVPTISPIQYLTARVDVLRILTFHLLYMMARRVQDLLGGRSLLTVVRAGN